jgi:hypothetical protein
MPNFKPKTTEQLRAIFGLGKKLGMEKAEPKTLAEWYVTLNTWEWPKELGEPELYTSDARMADTKRIAIMDWIKCDIGSRLVSRIWNSKMTDEEHKSYWVKWALQKDDWGHENTKV